MFLKILNNKITVNLFLQILTIAIPFFVSYYIIRIVDINQFGQYMYFFAIVNLFSLLLSSGLIQDGIRDLSKYYFTQKKMYFNLTVSEILVAKLLYLLFSIIISCILIFFNLFQNELYFSMLIYLIYYFFDFSLFYQATEKYLKIYFLLYFISVFISLIMILLFVKDYEHLLYLPLFITLPNICIQVILFLYFVFKEKIILFFHFSVGLRRIYSNFQIMLANIFVLGYTRTSIIVVGLFVDFNAVTFLVVSEQFYKVILVMINRFALVFSPRLTIINSIEKKYELFYKLFKITIYFSIVSYILIILCGDFVLKFFLKEKYSEISYYILLINSLNIIFISISSLCVNQFFLINKDSNIFIKYAIVTFFLGLPMIFIFTYLFGVFGSILTYGIIEFFVMFYFLKKLPFNILKFSFSKSN